MKEQLRDLSKELWELEAQCQNSVNISENLSKMENIISKLSLEDIFELALIMEEQDQNTHRVDKK